MIKLQVIGHLGKDCTSNNVGGKGVINFSVAHSERFKNQTGEEVSKTTWVECAWWTDKQGIVPYLKKGTQVFAEGQCEVKTFQKQDGTTRASLNMRVVSVQLLSGNNNQDPATSHPSIANAGKEKTFEPIVDANLPEGKLPF